MAPKRFNNRVLITASLCAAFALSAPPAPAGAASLDAKLGAPWVRHAAALIDDELEAASARAAERAEGPFVPVIGKVDYGTAENRFGAARSDHIHAGQDMFAPAGTPEVAATDAVVLETGTDGGQGNYVYLYDAKRDRTYVYMHMIAPAVVEQGQQVEAGQHLGDLGCTGSCWGDHLHFEVHDGRGFEAPARDPLPLLQDWRSLDHPR